MRRGIVVLSGLLVVLVPSALGAFPLTVHDALGRSVTVTRPPERIISLAPSITEILFALGLDSKIAGISVADDYPPDKVKSKPRVGGVQLDVERIVRIRPDLILGIPSLQRAQLDRLLAMRLPVLAVEANSLAQTYIQIKTIGVVTGESDASQRLVTTMRAKEAHVVAAVQGRLPVRVYVEVWGEPLIAAGGGTFIDDLLRLAGARNILADLRGWRQVSDESVIRRDPEVILLTYPQRARVLTRRGWAVVAAVRANRVVAVPEALVSRPGPRIVDGLAQIARILHPEAFP